MKTSTRQTIPRAADTKVRSLKVGEQPARRLSVVSKVRMPVQHPASKASLDEPALNTSNERRTPSPRELLDYQRDFVERSLLFWDTLRKRANIMLEHEHEHERASMPPLLDFHYETLVDARQFERPVNYALLRITQIGDDCWDDCVDLDKPPVIVIDPRAGHGPGIGGFKHDFEVGMAMHEGHPVYFVIFFSETVPGQTLADVLHALRCFVEGVAQRHPGKPPVLYGNCQAGWAVTLLAADCEGLTGPVVLNGSPLSYWAVNPAPTRCVCPAACSAAPGWRRTLRTSNPRKQFGRNTPIDSATSITNRIAFSNSSVGGMVSTF